MGRLWWTLLALAASTANAYPIVAREDSPSSELLDTVFTKPALAVLDFFKSGVGWMYYGVSILVDFLVGFLAEILYGVFILAAILIAVFVVCNECFCQLCGERASHRRRRAHESRLRMLSELPKIWEDSSSAICLPKHPSTPSTSDPSGPAIERSSSSSEGAKVERLPKDPGSGMFSPKEEDESVNREFHETPKSEWGKRLDSRKAPMNHSDDGVDQEGNNLPERRECERV